MKPNAGMEDEANTHAKKALIPDDILEELSRVAGNISKPKVQAYARRADVHEAVIAGQVRLMTKRWTHFSNMLGHGKVANALGFTRP